LTAPIRNNLLIPYLLSSLEVPNLASQSIAYKMWILSVLVASLGGKVRSSKSRNDEDLPLSVENVSIEGQRGLAHLQVNRRERDVVVTHVFDIYVIDGCKVFDAFCRNVQLNVDVFFDLKKL
jgi:hypothetical protein